MEESGDYQIGPEQRKRQLDEARCANSLSVARN